MNFIYCRSDGEWSASLPSQGLLYTMLSNLSLKKRVGKPELRLWFVLPIRFALGLILYAMFHLIMQEYGFQSIDSIFLFLTAFIILFTSC